MENVLQNIEISIVINSFQNMFIYISVGSKVQYEIYKANIIISILQRGEMKLIQTKSSLMTFCEW